MILFNPLTGESKKPDELNEDDRTTYDACMGAIELLKAQAPKLITRKKWDEWRHRPDGKRDPLFLQLDRTSGIWILKPEAWHEIAFLTGEVKVWNKKPTLEQMTAVKRND